MAVLTGWNVFMGLCAAVGAGHGMLAAGHAWNVDAARFRQQRALGAMALAVWLPAALGQSANFSSALVHLFMPPGAFAVGYLASWSARRLADFLT